MKNPTWALLIREYKGITWHWMDLSIIQRMEEQTSRLYVVSLFLQAKYMGDTHTYLLYYTHILYIKCIMYLKETGISPSQKK